MQNLVNTYLAKFRNERRTRRRLTCILLVLALVVGTGVYWQMHLTGVTAANEVFCGKEEHAHDDSCYQLVLACNQEESEEAEGHTHTEDCYEEQLVCGLEEHTHTVDCLTDPSADVEDSAVWEATLPDLTGVWADDVVAVARSQVGYTESTSNFVLDEDGETIRGYTRYGDWAGNDYGVWDAMFVSFCLHYAGISEDDFPESTGSYAWAVLLKNEGLYETAENYTPTPGDLVFFDSDRNDIIDSVGIIADVNAESQELTVIKGDYTTAEGTADTVAEIACSMDDSSIVGYGILPEGEIVAVDTTEGTDSISTVAVQALIDALPKVEDVKAMDINGQLEVYEQTQAAYGAFTSLTEIGQSEVDVTALEELLDFFNDLTLTLDDEDTESAGKNIVEYIEISDGATYEIIVSDADSNEIQPDSDGNYNLIEGKNYTIGLNFTFPAGIESGTYIYTFPVGTTLTSDSGKLYTTVNDESDVMIGSWKIDAETVTIVFELTDSVINLSDVVISASISVIFENVGDEVLLGNITYKIIEDTTFILSSLHKRAKSGASDNDGHIVWEIEIDGGGDTGLAGKTVTDTISTDNHLFTQEDIDIMEIAICDADEKIHILSISDDNLTWSESAWSITLPSSFYCSTCGKTITLPTEDSTGWIVYIEYTTTVTSSTSSYATYGNKVSFNGQEESGKIGTGSSGIDKSGVYKAGNADDWSDVAVTWTIDVFIPEGMIYNWYIYDSDDVVTDSGRQQYYYNDLGEDSITTIITALIDGNEYDVPNIDDAATDGSDLISWELYSTSTRGGYECTRIIWLYTWDSENNEWSLWWNIEGDTLLIITYTSSVVYDSNGDGIVDENLIQEYNAKDASLRNNVQLQNRGADGKTNTKVGEASAKVPLPSVVDKELTDEPDSENSYTTQYTVTFNEGKADLSNYSEVTLTDTMSSTLVFERDSIVITAKGVDGNTFTVNTEDYTVDYTSEASGNVVTIKLTGSALGPYEYNLVYNALLDGSGNVSYSNSIDVTVFGIQFEDSIGQKTVGDVTSTNKSYAITLLKTEEGNSSNQLSGAVFNVYNAEKGSLLTTATTDANGMAIVETDTIAGIILRAHTLYYLLEITAPEGYELEGETKYYFWFCDSISGACDSCVTMYSELSEDANVTYGTRETSINLTVTNKIEQSYTLPSTGGNGTWAYVMVGILLIFSAAGLLFGRRSVRL